jgi:hypothetical protein
MILYYRNYPIRMGQQLVFPRCQLFQYPPVQSYLICTRTYRIFRVTSCGILKKGCSLCQRCNLVRGALCAAMHQSNRVLEEKSHLRFSNSCHLQELCLGNGVIFPWLPWLETSSCSNL